ncbi:MAG: hypothetical protein Q4Q03_07870 [Bowdeniella nasicola]|nr:hypothetical protein [Bowdeniella nasicola]
MSEQDPKINWDGYRPPAEAEEAESWQETMAALEAQFDAHIQDSYQLRCVWVTGVESAAGLAGFACLHDFSTYTFSLTTGAAAFQIYPQTDEFNALLPELIPPEEVTDFTKQLATTLEMPVVLFASELKASADGQMENGRMSAWVYQPQAQVQTLSPALALMEFDGLVESLLLGIAGVEDLIHHHHSQEPKIIAAVKDIKRQVDDDET